LLCVAVCCGVLQCGAVCCSVLQCVAVCCSVLQCVAVCCSSLVCCSVLQCVAVCCSLLQSVRRASLIFNLVSSRILNLMRSVFLKMSEAHILQNICTTLQLFCSKSKYSPVGMTQVQTRTHIYRSCRRLDLKSLDLEICRFFL